jgi:hypothetical protein
MEQLRKLTPGSNSLGSGSSFLPVSNNKSPAAFTGGAFADF